MSNEAATVGRRAWGAILAVAILPVFVAAPFAHVHPEGVAEEHVAREHTGPVGVHPHLGRVERRPSWQAEADASARALRGFQFEVKEPVALSAMLDSAFVLLDRPSGTSATVVAKQLPARSPPIFSVRIPRAPPV